EVDRRVSERRAEPVRAARPRAEQPHRRGRPRSAKDDALASEARRPRDRSAPDGATARARRAAGPGRCRGEITEVSDMRRIEIFDTTLRDGEQAPGAALSSADKLRFAKALAELRVDTIEAGFPAASAEELEAVNLVAREVKGPTI